MIFFSFQLLNVLITRAKALLIVVGDHELLNQDKDWARFIQFVAKNSALVKEGKKLAARIEYPEDPAQKQRIYFEESFVTNVLK